MNKLYDSGVFGLYELNNDSIRIRVSDLTVKSSDGVGLSYALPCFIAALLLALALKRTAAVLTGALGGEEHA